jgi:26S proteasome regulatory subunit N8
MQSEIGAEEAEEVGVEHLLRDIKDTTVGTLSQKVTNQVMGLKGLHSKLEDMNNYVQQVRIAKLLGLWQTRFLKFILF